MQYVNPFLDHEFTRWFHCSKYHVPWKCYWCMEWTQRNILSMWLHSNLWTSMWDFWLKTRFEICLWNFHYSQDSMGGTSSLFPYTYLFMSTPMCMHKWHKNSKNHHKITRSICLTGSNDHFDLMRAQILLMNLLLTINKLFSMVLRHKIQYNIVHCDESKVLINASDIRRFQSKRHGSGASSFSSGNISNTFGYKNKYNSHCWRTGYNIYNYYIKHGFPPTMSRTIQQLILLLNP